MILSMRFNNVINPPSKLPILMEVSSHVGEVGGNMAGGGARGVDLYLRNSRFSFFSTLAEKLPVD